MVVLVTQLYVELDLIKQSSYKKFGVTGFKSYVLGVFSVIFNKSCSSV